MVPRYADLPGGRAVGLHGDDEQLGRLNLLTPERTLAAAGLVREGRVFSLNAPLDYPYPHPANLRRKPPVHTVVRHNRGRDDCVDSLWMHYGSQWDSFLHVVDPDHQCFYNGNTDESRGVEAWAARGIVGRGVLLDVARWRAAQGRPLDWRRRDIVTAADLRDCAEAQDVELGEGTILLIRFGWQTGWLALSPAERAAMAQEEFHCVGLDNSTDVVEFLWDAGVVAVAGDNMALEAYPLPAEMIHIDLLPRLGIPIGEFWWLDDLAEACAAARRHEFLLTSAPLHLKGGTGSTANAIAVM